MMNEQQEATMTRDAEFTKYLQQSKLSDEILGTTVAELLEKLFWANPARDEDVLGNDVRVALARMIGMASACYDDNDECARWRVLDLASKLLDTDGIDEGAANEIIEQLSAIAMFTQHEGNDLSPATCTQLEQIEAVGDQARQYLENKRLGGRMIEAEA